MSGGLDGAGGGAFFAAGSVTGAGANGARAAAVAAPPDDTDRGSAMGSGGGAVLCPLAGRASLPVPAAGAVTSARKVGGAGSAAVGLSSLGGP